jgi:hypothetical protein
MIRRATDSYFRVTDLKNFVLDFEVLNFGLSLEVD